MTTPSKQTKKNTLRVRTKSVLIGDVAFLAPGGHLQQNTISSPYTSGRNSKNVVCGVTQIDAAVKQL